jgi:hypothetical protein
MLSASPEPKPPSVQWRCPPIRPLTGAEGDRAVALYDRARRIEAASGHPARLAGFELEVTLRLLEGTLPLPEADNPYWRDKCRTLFARPAVEPIAYLHWRALMTGGIDGPGALRIASMLAARNVVLREGPGIGRSVMGDVEFEAADPQCSWLVEVRAATASPELLPALPMFAFARAITAHPFSDSNGRFARLLVQAGLARAGRLTRPCLPLAPIFYRNNETLAAGLKRLSEEGEWGPYYDACLGALEQAALAAERMFLDTREGAAPKAGPAASRINSNSNMSGRGD